MIRSLAVLVSLLLAVPALAGDAVALVTLASGTVTLDGEAVPAAPFVLPAGKGLNLADGASVVVLHEGTATRLRGPRTVSLSDLNAPSTGASERRRQALGAVLSRDVSFTKAGASRGGELQLVRPLPGGTVLAPRDIRWTCDGCGAQQVEVYAFLADEVVWTGQGAGAVAYAGPALDPGPYLVRIGAREFSFTVADKQTAARVNQARAAADEAREGLKSQGVEDVAALVSIPAGVYLRAGLPSEALSLIDQAIAEHPGNESLTVLRSHYERQAGLPQP